MIMMNILGLMGVLVAFVLVTTNAWEPDVSIYTNHMVMDADSKYHLYWTLSENDTIITFEAHVHDSGWFGLGFSPNGGMPGSDIVIGWYDKAGKAYLSDRHAITAGVPIVDAHNDYILLNSKKSDGYLYFQFSRKLQTCDKQDMDIDVDLVRALYAHGDEVPDCNGPMSRHEPRNRGNRATYFKDMTPPLEPIQKRVPDVYSLDILSKNAPVPEDFNTLYWCHVKELPTTDGVHHMIQHEPKIQKGHEPYVHHFILYACDKDMSAFKDKQEPCFDRLQTNFSAMYECTTKVLAGWAVGGGPHVYPDDVGMPIFEKNSAKWVMLEVHYDNSNYDKNIFDNSGIRLWITPTRRPIDAGMTMMGLGVNPFYQVVPPGVDSFTSYAYCPASCTGDVLMPEGITVFSGLLHSHLLGRKLRLRHIRNGKELEPLFQDNHYDFNYQEPREKRHRPQILPGDEFIMECEMNSKGRSKNTYSGYGTGDEMCLAFMDYYPRNKAVLGSCMNAPAFVPGQGLLAALGVQNASASNMGNGNVVQKMDGEWMPFKQYVDEHIVWDEDTVKKFQDAAREGPYFVSCGGYTNKSAPPTPTVAAAAEEDESLDQNQFHFRQHLRGVSVIDRSAKLQASVDALNLEKKKPPNGMREVPIWMVKYSPIHITQHYKPPNRCAVEPKLNVFLRTVANIQFGGAQQLFKSMGDDGPQQFMPITCPIINSATHSNLFAGPFVLLISTVAAWMLHNQL